MPRRRIAIVAVGVILLVGSLFFIQGGIYPVAIVNDSVITQREFSRAHRAASHYYETLRTQVSHRTTSTKILDQNEIELSVLNQLVENALVQEAMRRETGEIGDELVMEKVRRVENDPDVAAGARTLYGVDIVKFREIILLPQAERDILSARLYLKGEKFNEWLMKEKQSARVRILSPRYEWNGEEVVKR